jgi:hypothetical protein
MAKFERGDQVLYTGSHLAPPTHKKNLPGYITEVEPDISDKLRELCPGDT